MAAPGGGRNRGARRGDPAGIAKQTAERLADYLARLEEVRRSLDLPGLHRLVVDIQVEMPESLVHENRVLLLDGLRVHHAEHIEPYAAGLTQRLGELHRLYREKSGGRHGEAGEGGAGRPPRQG